MSDDGWLPIDTAPRDGTLIDIWCRRSWDPPEGYERRVDVYWDNAHDCWRTLDNTHFIEQIFKPSQSAHDRRLIPMYWRPLPKPPAGCTQRTKAWGCD